MHARSDVTEIIHWNLTIFSITQLLKVTEVGEKLFTLI